MRRTGRLKEPSSSGARCAGPFGNDEVVAAAAGPINSPRLSLIPLLDLDDISSN